MISFISKRSNSDNSDVLSKQQYYVQVYRRDIRIVGHEEREMKTR